MSLSMQQAPPHKKNHGLLHTTEVIIFEAIVYHKLETSIVANYQTKKITYTMFQSVAHDVLALLVLLVKTADASFDGPPIKFNIYGGGGLVPCQESDITITGETTKMFVLETAAEEDALCNHDVLYLPDGTNFTAYSKLHNIECTADVMEIEVYTCFDEACRNCSSSMDMDAFVTTSNIKVLLEDPFACVETFNATDNGTASGGLLEFWNHIESMSAQHRFLDTENDQDAVAEYWNYFFEKSCGVEWLAEVTASTASSMMVKYGSPILGSVFSAVAMAVAIVVAV